MSDDNVITFDGTGRKTETDPFGEKPKEPKKRRAAPGEAAGTRVEHDAYDTPEPLALACAAWVRDVIYYPAHGPLVIEPTAGSGSFVKAIRTTWPDSTILAVDIRPECAAMGEAAGADKALTFDALTMPPETVARADLILTNPPFKLADALVRHFWKHMKPRAHLAFLLSVTFIGSADRWEDGEHKGLFLHAPPRYVVPIVPRPAFTGTSPKFEAALFVWTKELTAQTKDGPVILIPASPIRWVPAKKPRKPRGMKGGTS